MFVIEIYLSVNNNEQIIQLPVLPNKFEVNSSYKNSTKASISQGEIRLIGLQGLKTISFDSFFPYRAYPFARNNRIIEIDGKKYDIFDRYSDLTNHKNFYGWSYVRTIEEWMKKRVPIRVIITDLENDAVNLPMTIDSFKYGIQDGSNDIKYTISLTEFRFVKLEERTVEKDA